MANSSHTPLTPTQRMVLAQRLSRLRTLSSKSAATVSRDVLGYTNFSEAVTRLERGRQALVNTEHLRRLAVAYETTEAALLALPAHIETYSGNEFSGEDWPRRFALLCDGFKLSRTDIETRLALVSGSPRSTYESLVAPGARPQQTALHMLAALTDVSVGWLCLGSRLPPLKVAPPGLVPLALVPTQGEDARHDPKGWTPAHQKRAARYVRR